MKRLFLLMTFMLAAAAADARRVRVFYEPNGEVRVLSPNCARGETPESCLARVGAKDCPRTARGSCLPFDDMDDSALPSREKRDKWRGRKGAGVRVDESVITHKERVDAAAAALDAELAKPAPDPVQVIRLSRALEKFKGR